MQGAYCLPAAWTCHVVPVWGTPHPDLGPGWGVPILLMGGTPVQTWDGGTSPILTWEGGTPCPDLGQGTPLILTRDGVPPSWDGIPPPHPDLGRGYPHPDLGKRYPPISQMGVPPSPVGVDGQMPEKTLPSPYFGMRAVKTDNFF